MDPTLIIDGKKANCKFTSLGVQRSRPSTPQHDVHFYSLLFINLISLIIFNIFQ